VIHFGRIDSSFVHLLTFALPAVQRSQNCVLVFNNNNNNVFLLILIPLLSARRLAIAFGIFALALSFLRNRLLATMAEVKTAEPVTWSFPNTFTRSAAHWWNSSGKHESQASEEALVRRGLQNIPLVDASEADQDRDGQRAVFRKVQLEGHSDPRYYLNTLEIGNYRRDPDENIVLTMHGYGNGLAFWWQNFQAFASVPKTRTIFVDWLGMGRSGRPSFPSIKSKGDTEEAIQARVSSAENFFLESLDQLCKNVGANKKVTLVGHSIGGYLSTAFAVKHPETVNKLILVSPVGVPKSPYRTTKQQTGVDKSKQGKSENGKTNDATPPAELLPADASEPTQDAPSGWWTKLWEANVSPFSVIRMSTVFGPQLISRYASRRFAAFPEEVQKELFNYLYQISSARGSGEYVLAHVLAPGAYARWPLITRIGVLNTPVTVIYGDHDWMDEKGGYDTIKLLKAKPDTPETRLQKLRSKVLINEHAGHWVHLENPAGFNKMLERELREALQDAADSR